MFETDKLFSVLNDLKSWYNKSCIDKICKSLISTQAVVERLTDNSTLEKTKKFSQQLHYHQLKGKS